jgi:hypothetical protein
MFKSNIQLDINLEPTENAVKNISNYKRIIITLITYIAMQY